ncbi:uncharacterized protein LOC141678425 isoform X2 [Apium graveolens]
MGDVRKILRFDWRSEIVELVVDPEKCTLLDLIVEYEEEGKKLGQKLNYSYPTFTYVFQQRHWKLEKDVELIKMFDKLSDRSVITIWVGTTLKPNSLYKLVISLRSKNEGADNARPDDNIALPNDDFPSLDEIDDTSVNQTTKEQTKAKTITKTKAKPKVKPKLKVNTALPPSISPNTAFKSLTIQRSPRFSPQQNINLTSPTPVSAPTSASDQSMFARKIPKTIAKRKGYTAESDNQMGEIGGSVRFKSANWKVEFYGEIVCVENVSEENNNAEESTYDVVDNNSDS